jgi:hypothetical protein
MLSIASTASGRALLPRREHRRPSDAVSVGFDIRHGCPRMGPPPEDSRADGHGP